MRTARLSFIVVLSLTIACLPVKPQAAEVGGQAYLVLESGYSMLFLSVRSWPLQNLAISGGMGETISDGNARPSLNGKALWRFSNLGNINLQTAVSLISTYHLDDSPMPQFDRLDLLWTAELEYWLPQVGRVSVSIGSPVGWDDLAVTLGVGVHVLY